MNSVSVSELRSGAFVAACAIGLRLRGGVVSVAHVLLSMSVRAGDPCTKGGPAQVPRPKGRQSPRAPLSRGRRGATHVIGGEGRNR